MTAQVLAGIGLNGVNLSIGKREVTEVTEAEAAGIGLNGVNLSIGKREITEVTEAEARFILDALNQAINDVFTNVFQKPLEDALSSMHW